LRQLACLLVFVIVTGCGDDGAGVDAGVDSFVAQCTPSVSIAQNHGHVMVVTLDEINGGADKAYDIMGTADHSHRVTLSAVDYAMLQQGTTVGTRSSDASSGPAHTHAVRIQCN
jgi:hypothetical protein